MTKRLNISLTGLLLNSFIDRFYYLKPDLYLNKLKLVNIVASEQQYASNKILNLTYFNLTLKLLYKHDFHCHLFILPYFGYKPELTCKLDNKNKFYKTFNFTQLSKNIKLQCLFKVIFNNIKIRSNFNLNNNRNTYNPNQHLYGINHIHKTLYILDQNSNSQINHINDLNFNTNYFKLNFEFCRNILNLMDSEFVYLINLETK